MASRSQVQIPNGKSYTGLFEALHNFEFHWTIPHDDNRMQDGLDLRYEYLGEDKKKLESSRSHTSRNFDKSQ